MEVCNCKKKNCERYGKCLECLEYHKHKKREAYCKSKNIEERLSKKSKEEAKIFNENIVKYGK